MKGLRTVLCTLVIVAAIGVGVVAVSTEVDASGLEPCRCIPFFDPVVCNGGRVFPNQCEADCARAKECRPALSTIGGSGGD